MAYIREDQASISVTVAGASPTTLGTPWKTMEGGVLEADDSKTRPGGMGREVAIGGPAQRDDLTVTTQFTEVVANWHASLENLVGTARVTVGVAWLGADRVPNGTGFTRTGVLKRAAAPNSDAESSTAGMYELVISCDEQAA